MSTSAAEAPPQLDPITRLQLAVSDLSGLYTNALGKVLNTAELTVQIDGLKRKHDLQPEEAAALQRFQGEMAQLQQQYSGSPGGSASGEWNAITPMATDFGEQVAKAHHEIDVLADALRGRHRSEQAQLERLRELDDEHAAVTQELRSEVQAAEVIREELRRDLDSLIDGITQQRSLVPMA